MSKKWWTALAIILTLLSIGAVSESNRIRTSDAPDIARNRERLKSMSYTMTSLLIGGVVFCWYRTEVFALALTAWPVAR